jgi:hypothetical protein
VQGAFVEPGHDRKRVAAELARELERLRTWLELDRIDVADRGNLARQLRVESPASARAPSSRRRRRQARSARSPRGRP